MRLLADENFDGRVVRGLLRRLPTLDLVRVQDVGLSAAGDPAVLAWAATAGRVVLTHDVKTMGRFAADRVAAGLAMPGVVEVPSRLTVRQAIGELLVLVGAGRPDDLDGQVVFLPL